MLPRQTGTRGLDQGRKERCHGEECTMWAREEECTEGNVCIFKAAHGTHLRSLAKSLYPLLSLSVYLRRPPSLSFPPFLHLWGRTKSRRTLKNQSQEQRDQFLPFRRAQEWNLDLVWGKCPGWCKSCLWSMNGLFVWLGNGFILSNACCQGFSSKQQQFAAS